MPLFPREVLVFPLEVEPDRALEALRARLASTPIHALVRGGLHGHVSIRHIVLTSVPQPTAQLGFHSASQTFRGRLDTERGRFEGVISPPLLLKGLSVLGAVGLVAILGWALALARRGELSWSLFSLLGAFGGGFGVMAALPFLAWARGAEARYTVEAALQGAARGVGV